MVIIQYPSLHAFLRPSSSWRFSSWLRASITITVMCSLAMCWFLLLNHLGRFDLFWAVFAFVCTFFNYASLLGQQTHAERARSEYELLQSTHNYSVYTSSFFIKSIWKHWRAVHVFACNNLKLLDFCPLVSLFLCICACAYPSRLQCCQLPREFDGNTVT